MATGLDTDRMGHHRRRSLWTPLMVLLTVSTMAAPSCLVVMVYHLLHISLAAIHRAGTLPGTAQG